MKSTDVAGKEERARARHRDVDIIGRVAAFRSRAVNVARYQRRLAEQRSEIKGRDKGIHLGLAGERSVSESDSRPAPLSYLLTTSIQRAAEAAIDHRAGF